MPLHPSERKIASVALPIPDPEDLPRHFSFRGWWKATNYPGWYAYIMYEKANCPPMAQQITFSIFQLENLSQKARKALLRAEIERVVAETQRSLIALGWMDWDKPIMSNPSVYQGGFQNEN